MSDENVTVKFGGETGEAQAAIAQVRDMLGNLGAPVKQLAEAFAGLWVVDKVKDFTQSVARAVEEISALGETAERSAAMTGAGIERIQELGKIAELSGGSSDGMVMGIVRLERALGSAGDQADKIKQTFSGMGIATTNAGGLRDINSLMGDLAERFSQAPDGIQKTTIAMELMGRNGAAMIPVLNKGREGWEEMAREIEKTRSVMGAATAAEFAHLHDQIELQGMAFQGLGITITDAFAPALTSITEGITELVESFTASISQGGALKPVLDLLVAGFEALVAVVAALSIGLQQVWHLALAATYALSAAGEAMTLNFTAAGAMIEKAKGHMEEIGKLGKGWVDDFWNRGAFEREKPTKTGSNNLGGLPDLQAQKEEVEAYIQAIKTKQEANRDNYEYVMHLENQLLDFLRQKYGEDSAQYQKELQNKERMEYHHTQTMMRQWRQALSFIGSDWSNAINSWIEGTATFTQAFGKMITDMATHFIQKVAEMIAEWLLFQAITGLFGGSTATSFFGGVPLLGSLDVGSSFIPQTGPYLLHEGERVLTRAENEQIRTGKGTMGGQEMVAGGDTYNVTVQAIDTRSGVQFLMDNAAAVAGAMQKASRNFNPAAKMAWKGT